MKDKREECGCHRRCHTDPHECANPCQWPACLTTEEHEELSLSLRDVETYWDGWV